MSITTVYLQLYGVGIPYRNAESEFEKAVQKSTLNSAWVEAKKSTYALFQLDMC